MSEDRRGRRGPNRVAWSRGPARGRTTTPTPTSRPRCALYSLLDPLTTIEGLSANIGVPVGAVCRYVLARWASGGSGGLLELGPSMVQRLWEVCERAEGEGTDESRLAAYDQLRQMLSWLRLPLVDPAGYGRATGA